jgi:hypothetical protein
MSGRAKLPYNKYISRSADHLAYLQYAFCDGFHQPDLKSKFVIVKQCLNTRYETRTTGQVMPLQQEHLPVNGVK